ncbi:MAG: phosphoribosylformylglycinamidine synthase subunit PurS [Deltaproteobacteria bacterium]|nr:phosphoribosylformylglycinamidine synthase subunit PurS [Deltaproteobacteria bacterium]
MKAKVYVTLKKGVLDPQGKAVAHALHSMSYKSVGDVRQGKFFEVSLHGVTRAEAEKQVKEMGEKLLANTVIEDYRFEIMDGE